jgi:hypothetical protein
MICKVIWNSLSVEEWENRIRQIKRFPLLQSMPYAQAMRKAHQQSTRFGLILINGEEAGLCTFQEVGLFKKAIHAISSDLGPVWFEGYGKPEHWRGFLNEINQQFPRRFGRRRRLIPFMADKAQHLQLMSETGWHHVTKSKKYQTIWLDLSPEPEELRKNFKQKWRNALNKSEKRELTLDIDERGESLKFLLNNYMKDRLEKRYAGASPKMIAALAEFTLPTNECLVFNAISGAQIIASILIFTHGHSATYQIGWSSSEGRDNNAHYFLLWHAICTLRKKGMTAFDLGGINDDDAKGVKNFKSGLGGHEMTLIGQYD